MTAAPERWQLEGDSAELYERYLVPPVTLPWAVDLVERVGVEAGGRVLDVACGTGAGARGVAARGGGGGRGVGGGGDRRVVRGGRARSARAGWVGGSGAGGAGVVRGERACASVRGWRVRCGVLPARVAVLSGSAGGAVGDAACDRAGRAFRGERLLLDRTEPCGGSTLGRSRSAFR